MVDNTILTAAQVCEALTISIPTLYRYMKTVDDFPPKIKLGPRRVGFRRADVDAYIERRMEGSEG